MNIIETMSDTQVGKKAIIFQEAMKKEVHTSASRAKNSRSQNPAVTSGLDQQRTFGHLPLLRPELALKET